MKNKLNYTCLFGGGGARGFAYCGTLKALEEMSIEFSMLGGSSVGSIFAALIAVGYTSAELKNIFKQVNFELFRDIHFGLGKDFALSKGEVFTEWLRELLQAKVWGSDSVDIDKPVTFRDVKIPLVIITTNLSNFKCQEFSQEETPDYEVAEAVRISCSMPGLMTPKSFREMKLVDGDLQKSKPMWQLSKSISRNSSRIIEFRLEGDYSGKEGNAIDFLNTIYSCMTYVSTEFVTNIFKKNDRYECITINTKNTIIVDFNMSQTIRDELFDIGYHDTMNYFKKFLLLKKRFLLGKYKELFIILKELEHSLNNRYIIKSKTALGELFMELADCRDNIDEFIYRDFLTLRDKYKSSLKSNFFTGETLNDIDTIKGITKNLVSATANRIKDLESYLQNK